ncbi:lysoplasmalogenase family protein [Sphingomonas sp.]|uniref:lysoplasmalogenase family protein n=1 Tax=Sphingomonas sp. TaxID=28214 RepID=UPI002DD677FB|nr:lysoplasmalogenase family protein [Sphingomonas sp.]
MSILPRVAPQALFAFALVMGISYFIAIRAGFTGADMTAWKGSGVALLAIWAARHADSTEGWAIAVVLAAGATGDVLLETHGLITGAVAFLIGHLLAVTLYARGRWRRGWPVVAGAAVLVSGVSFALTGGPGVALYAAGLGAMAGAASLGRFGPLAIAGAWLFVLSDWLIFARLGPLAHSAIPDWTVWPTYFAGQALIAWGVVSTLDRPEPAPELAV